MKKELIEQFLIEEDKAQVEKYVSYVVRLVSEKDKTGALKNSWALNITESKFADLFKRVKSDGLVFDGVHITLQRTGISYDYIAYKNKMLLAYPESKVDVNLVYKDDEFSFEKESGSVKYTHKIANPFLKDDKDIIGGYCVIKNKRGEFLTLLSKAEIDKHRKVAKTDYIWVKWFSEMALKTLIKKACKQHFADVFQSIEEKDNDNYDLENPLDLEIETKSKIDSATNIEELTKIYNELKDKVDNKSAFNSYITIKRGQLK